MKTSFMVIVAAASITLAIGAYLFLSQSPSVRTIELSARDFGYNDIKGGPTIRVKVGETVRLVLKNEGGIEHEIMIVEDLKTDGHPKTVFKGAEIKDLEPRQSGVATFVADKPGKYYYACFEDAGTRPQKHTDRGMFGEFIVEG